MLWSDPMTEMAMLTPLLSEEDPVASSEGSLDPLGLYQIADSLGVRLVPGVRERQQHPRFLTATAVSLAVCASFDEDTIAKDGVSEPWQVFEWYLVEGLVRAVKETRRLRGLPGRDKTTRAVRDGVPLSAKRYLKTPTVFGFHGVYRLLSRTLRIEVADRLGDAGYELLDVWRSEQGLRGFYESAEGDGQQWYRSLVAAMKDGIDQGTVGRSGGWNGWQFMADHLCHADMGRKEARTIAGFLLSDQAGNRKALLDFLVSPDGQKIRNAIQERNDCERIWSEREFHAAMVKKADGSLGALLSTIMTYETFARTLQDAFDDCLCEMSLRRGKTSMSALAKQKNVVRAAKTIPDLLTRTAEALTPFGETVRFQNLFDALAERTTPEGWVHILLDHHTKVQKAKPPGPGGKAPWFERMDDGSCVIRPGYLRDKGGRGDDAYVHAYRVAPLWSFATDLRLL